MLVSIPNGFLNPIKQRDEIIKKVIGGEVPMFTNRRPNPLEVLYALW
jgi:hypothetical protein